MRERLTRTGCQPQQLPSPLCMLASIASVQAEAADAPRISISDTPCNRQRLNRCMGYAPGLVLKSRAELLANAWFWCVPRECDSMGTYLWKEQAC